MWLVDRAQMRAIDQYVMEQVGVDVLALMELAGAAVARACVEYARTIGKHDSLSVHVVAGKGHNGADGVVAARHLLAQGCNVRVWLTSPLAQLSAAGKKQVQAYVALGGTFAESDDDLAQADLIIDALLGTGSRLPLEGSLRPYAQAIARSGRPVIAVDIPSGLDVDTGQADLDAIPANVTVTFGYAKLGLYQYPGKTLAGNVVIEPLSMSPSLAVSRGAYGMVLTDEEWMHWRTQRDPDSHKGSFGKLGIVAGSHGMFGAARLALGAAYRAGAGLVEFFCGADLPAAFWVSLPAEVLVHFYDGKSGVWDETAISQLLQWTQELRAVALGPGMGEGIRALAQLSPAGLQRFAEIPQPLLLDADFLHALALLPDHGEKWFALRTHPTIITPHPKEFGRLIQRETDEVQKNRIAYARDYAIANRVIVVLKGAGTVTALPDGRVYINTSGNHGLSTGGSGDVLAGYIAGLLASGYPADRAAPLGVYLHGKAADMARDAGQCEESFMASDLLSWLSRVYTPLFPTGN